MIGMLKCDSSQVKGNRHQSSDCGSEICKQPRSAWLWAKQHINRRPGVTHVHTSPPPLLQPLKSRANIKCNPDCIVKSTGLEQLWYHPLTHARNNRPLPVLTRTIERL